MSSIIYPEEFEVLELFELSSWDSIDGPFLVCSSIKVIFARPFNSSSPSFSSTPVADVVLVSTIDQDLYTVLQNTCHLWLERYHPVAEQFHVHRGLAVFPFSSWDSQISLYFRLIKEYACIIEIIAKWWLSARNSDIIHIEFWVERITEDRLNKYLTDLKRNKVRHTRCYQFLATKETSLEDVVESWTYQIVLVSKVGVGWVLVIRINPSISDGDSFEIDFDIGSIID